MRDRADGFGILATRDGGYLVTGDTVLSSGMGVWNAFVIKTDAKGVVLWNKQFGCQSAAQGVLINTKRLSTQTSDGNYVVAGDIIDFYDADYVSKKEGWGDVLVTKLNTSGNVMWSTMVGDYSMDFPQKLWAAPDGGVILLAKLKKTGQTQEIADFDAVPEYSVVIKFDGNGKVQWSKKMNWAATDMEYLADGSYVALTIIETRLAAQQDAGADSAIDAIPTIIKLDGALNVLWAKSIEAPPMSYSTVTGTTRETAKITQTKIRMSGGDFRRVEQAPDGGFIAFGRFFSTAKYLSGDTDVDIKTLADPIPYVAVKVNAQGKYQWAKSVKTAFGSMEADLDTTKTSDNAFVLSRNVMRQEGGFSLEGMASTVELMKVDANFNPRWIRKIDIERDATGRDIQATSDGGVALTGRIVTNEKHMIMGSPEPYEETFLIKADTNGNVSGANVVTPITQAEVMDQSSYLIMQDMHVLSEDMTLPVNKNVKATVSNIKYLQRTIAPHAKTTVTPVCSTLNTGTPGTPSSPGQGGTAPQAFSYPQIKYDTVKEAKIETEKSRQINDELFPILQKVFNNQVKMTDNMSGLWLTYIFPHQATVADREAVQAEYVKLGYKVDEAVGGLLTVSKIGLSLRMTFSINNAMVGQLEVLF